VKAPEPAPASQALVPLAAPPVAAAAEPALEKAIAEAVPAAAREEKIEELPAEQAPIEEGPAVVDAVEAPVLAQPAANASDQAANLLDTTRVEQANELLKKGQRLLVQRDAPGARTALEQALAMQADNPHVRASLAEALLKLNELPLALVQAQTAVKLRPKRGRYLVLQGDVLAAMGKADEARATFRRAFELDPNDVEAKRKAGL
jgi:tetratricopeptide (TPR) repeat protein